MPHSIYATPTGTTGELCELSWGQRHPRLTVELFELFDCDRFRRHIDSERECFSGKNELNESRLEECFHDGFKLWDQPCVVGGDAALKSGKPRGIAEHCEIFFTEGSEFVLHNTADRLTLFSGREPDTIVEAF